MTRSGLIKLASVSALAIAVLAANASTIDWSNATAGGSTAVSVVSATSSSLIAAAPAAIVVDPTACNTVLCTPVSPPPPAAGRCNIAADPLLRDLAYFANDWTHLEKKAGSLPIPLGGGYVNSRVLRDDDGTFFAGVVERNGDGRVTDVVLALAGANTADDFASAPAFIAGQETPQLRRAVALYQSLLDDPSYASAKFHVTGFSLGAGLTQYLLGYTLSRYGERFVDDRTTFDAFGVPGWERGTSIRFGVDRARFAGRFRGYTAENDVVQLLGDSPMGTRFLLAPYTPVGTLPGAPANGVVAHTPYPYMAAFGLPDWLGERKADVKARVEASQTLPTDPDYGTPGRVPFKVWGDGARNVVNGSDLADTISSGGGGDMLCGGAGADRFVYSSASDSLSTTIDADVIADFGDDGDVIDLSQIAAGAGIDALTYVGEQAFTGTGQVRSHREGGDTVITVNLRGDAAPEMLIRLTGFVGLTGRSLVLDAPRRTL